MQPLATSSSEVNSLLNWLRDEMNRTQFGEVGLKFKLHDGHIVGIEKTTSVKGRFELKFLNGDSGD